MPSTPPYDRNTPLEAMADPRAAKVVLGCRQHPLSMDASHTAANDNAPRDANDYSGMPIFGVDIRRHPRHGHDEITIAAPA
jgi:hypothetical protein